MDWAFNRGILSSLESKETSFQTEQIKKLLDSTVPPSLVQGFTQTDAFIHYLECVRHQIMCLNKPSYHEALSSYEMLLRKAEFEIERLEKAGMFAQTRSFRDLIDVNRAAVQKLDQSMGFSLKMSWTHS
jgi:hypothetical protein